MPHSPRTRTKARRSISRQMPSLPPELLRQIFEEGSPGGPGDSYEASSYAFCRPDQYLEDRLAISWTCHQFRSIILSSPRCWTFVRLLMVAGQEFDPEWLDTLLSRSNQLPFDLSIELKYSYDEEPEEDLRAALRNHWHRCRSLHLYSDGDEMSAIGQLLEDVSLPSLRFLKISQPELSGEPVIQDLFPFDQPTTISLSALSVIQGHLDSMFEVSAWPPLSGLKQLHLAACIFPLAIPAILAQCTSLEHLWWHYEHPDFHLQSQRIRISLPHLRSLQLAGTAVTAFARLNAPLLEQMELRVPEGEAHFLKPTRHSSFPLLRRFACSMHALSQAMIEHILRQCAEVEEIAILDFAVSDGDEISITDILDAIVAHLTDEERDSDSEMISEGADQDDNGGDEEDEEDGEDGEDEDAEVDSDADDDEEVIGSEAEGDDGATRSGTGSRNGPSVLLDPSANPTPATRVLHLELNPFEEDLFAGDDCEDALREITTTLRAVSNLRLHVKSTAYGIVDGFEFSRRLEKLRNAGRFRTSERARYEDWPSAWNGWYTLVDVRE